MQKRSKTDNRMFLDISSPPKDVEEEVKEKKDIAQKKTKIKKWKKTDKHRDWF